MKHIALQGTRLVIQTQLDSTAGSIGIGKVPSIHVVVGDLQKRNDHGPLFEMNLQTCQPSQTP